MSKKLRRPHKGNKNSYGRQTKEDASTLFFQGKEYYKQREWKKAIKCFKNASKKNAELDNNANFYTGKCYLSMGKYEKAIEMFNKCLGRNTKSASIRIELARAYEFIGNINKAEELLKDIIENSNTVQQESPYSQVYAKTALADLHKRTGNVAKAEELLYEVIELCPEFKYPYVVLGGIHEKEGRYRQAAE